MSVALAAARQKVLDNVATDSGWRCRWQMGRRDGLLFKSRDACYLAFAGLPIFAPDRRSSALLQSHDDGSAPVGRRRRGANDSQPDFYFV